LLHQTTQKNNTKINNMKTANFETKQEGYGRQGLYFVFDGKMHYICSVFPNVEEHLNIRYIDYCFENEDGVIVDCNGHEVTPYTDLNQILLDNYKKEIGEILYENLDFENYDFDFENATYEDITDWAIQYK